MFLAIMLGWVKHQSFKFSAQKGRENDFVAVQAEDGYENKYVSNALREELLCVVVSSEQNLSYQLSYTSKFTLLSKVTKSFHDKLNESPERVGRLKDLFENNTFERIQVCGCRFYLLAHLSALRI